MVLVKEMDKDVYQLANYILAKCNFIYEQQLYK